MAQRIQPPGNKTEDQAEDRTSVLYETAFIRRNNGSYWNCNTVHIKWGCNSFFNYVAFGSIFDADTGKGYGILEGRFWIVTKKEYEKCEKLMEEAIRKVNNSNEDYKAYERLCEEGKEVDAKCKLRLADQEIGYAEGINQALAILNFKHNRMKELSELL